MRSSLCSDFWSFLLVFASCTHLNDKRLVLNLNYIMQVATVYIIVIIGIDKSYLQYDMVKNLKIFAHLLT